MVDVAMGRGWSLASVAGAAIAAWAGLAAAAATPSATPTATALPAVATVTATITATPVATPWLTATPTPAATAAQAPPSASAVNPGQTPGVIALLQTRDGSERDPGNWIVRVYKSRHRLEVWYKGRFYRSYRAVFGRNLDTSAKLFAGDRRTPEGSYLIISKYPSRRWRYFLRLNYPNLIDLSRFEELRAAHEIAAADAGGSIGIHGTDVPMLNEGNINWTTGCISVDNGAIDELEALLPVGTTVVIKP